MTDLDELRRLAEAATPGPWRVDTDAPMPSVADCNGLQVAEVDGYDNRRLIAAANPATVLALLDRLAAAEALLTETLAWSEVCDLRPRTRIGVLVERIAAHLAGKGGAG